MGITIVKKGAPGKISKNSKKALILAGGAITGASFMSGGLKALNDYMDGFSVNDFDMFVGISAGSLLAAPLVAGIPPEEMLKSIDGRSKKFSKFSAWHYYCPNIGEYFTKPAGFFRKMLSKKGTVSSIYEMLPSGLFDNSPIEHYIRKNIEKNDLTNSFKGVHKATGKGLYVVASKLDDAKRAVFGHDEINNVCISEAIQASTAMPGFYRPVHINGEDYVDGGVQQTASIDIAVDKGADLIICYNPFRPNTKKGRIAGEGVMSVMNQIFMTFFHNRLHVVLEKFKNDPDFHGDIILIEPKDDDEAFFDLNPLMFSNRIKAACMGFESVTRSINEHYSKIEEVLCRHGIKMSKKKVDKEAEVLVKSAKDVERLREILER